MGNSSRSREKRRARHHFGRDEPSTEMPSQNGHASHQVFIKPADALSDILAYQQDFAERCVLFLDVMRRRANVMLEHEMAGLPPLLDFDYEVLLDARRFDPPANYELLRITRAGDVCWDDCLNPEKPPVIVLDPRAGHGPGIGGSKRESEVGVAMHTGHSVYFVAFFPEPALHQTLADVLAALRRFVAHVSALHTKPPILYGNCQAGWAVTLLSSHCQGLVGPVVMNGSPLSYWAGEARVNPMRILGAFTGGVWLAHLLADLNLGRFDGAWLVQNFEALKPGNAAWDKYANLFTRIETETPRFLEFERWWNGFYRLSTEEIVSIIEDLFIGNKLEQGLVHVDEHCVANLKAIKNPIVIFASYGDNITPPHQALGWIAQVYETNKALREAGQRIVYLINPHVGHLGIFVSAKVARFEHRALLENMDTIEALDPGLYEMTIDNPTGNPDCRTDQYKVHFHPRGVGDLHFDAPRQAFERVQQVSEQNGALYRTFVSPWVKMIANPWLATWMQWMHPMRLRTYMWSEHFMPWMEPVSIWAAHISQQRHELPDDHPLVVREREFITAISSAWERSTRLRDAMLEKVFKDVFE